MIIREPVLKIQDLPADDPPGTVRWVTELNVAYVRHYDAWLRRDETDEEVIVVSEDLKPGDTVVVDKPSRRLKRVTQATNAPKWWPEAPADKR